MGHEVKRSYQRHVLFGPGFSFKAPVLSYGVRISLEHPRACILEYVQSGRRPRKET